MFSGLTERRRERFVGLYIFIGLRGKVCTLLSMFYELQSSSLRISLPIYQNSLHCESEIKMAWFLSENGFPKCRYIILLKCTAKMSNCIEEETDRREGKGRRCCWGTEFVQLHSALQIQHQDDLKKRMLQRNGRSSGSHHHPPKMDVLPKTVL